MKRAYLLLLPAALLAAPAAAAPAPDPRIAEANAAFTNYPKESLRNNEQGIVHYRVKIDGAGRVTRCEVLESSGHNRLDLATCGLLLDQVRFTPARNEKGRARRSSLEGRVHWRLS
jgi:protein TonB